MTPERSRNLAAVGCAYYLAAAVALAGQSSATGDLVFGTWILDTEASTYDPGPAPKSQTRTYEAHLDGVRTTVETVDAKGRSFFVEYVADYDSVEYPISGSPNVDAISLERVNLHTAVATLMHAREKIGTARRTISEDGETMTIVYDGRDPRGRTVSITAVYERAGTP